MWTWRIRVRKLWKDKVVATCYSLQLLKCLVRLFKDNLDDDVVDNEERAKNIVQEE